MAYLVIARKWRPQTFENVVGQPHVTKTLQNAIRSGRVAHAYLFTGARGVGKTSVARILAKALNCEQQEGALRPCNRCSNCREITQGNAVDVLEIDGASNRGIDNIRELRETVRYRPAKGRFKIYIIDEVHMLTSEAFNALLKTLEEPPEHVLFVFATTEPHKIPSTILSRCQRFDFRRIPPDQIVKLLREIVKQEGVELSDAVFYAVAREADGSIRDSESLLEQLLAFSGDGLSDEEILDVLGIVDRRSVHRVAEAVLAGDVRTCLEVVGEIYRRGVDSRRFCQQVCDHFRNLLFFSLGEGQAPGSLDVPEEEKLLLRDQSGRTSPDSLYLYFQILLRGEEEIRRSSLPRIALEMLLLRLSQLPRLESLETVLERLTALESLAASVPRGTLDEIALSPGPDAVRIAPCRDNVPSGRMSSSVDLGLSAHRDVIVSTVGREPPVVPSTVGEVAGRWTQFLHWLNGNNPVLAAKLNQSRFSLVSETEAELEIIEIYENAVKEPQNLDRLRSAVAAFFGVDLGWTVKVRSTISPTPVETPASKTPKISVKRQVLEHPAVRNALEILSGEILEIKILKPGSGEKAQGRTRDQTGEPSETE